MERNHIPEKQGMYAPEFEHDNCGVGFVCHVKGRQSHEMVQKGVEVLHRLAHRGATGSDPQTGDGAGILMQVPHDFFIKAAKEIGITLPPLGSYGTGLVFFPQDKRERQFCRDIFEKVVKEEGQKILCWRKVPVDNSEIGRSAVETQPVIEQPFIQRNNEIEDDIGFERKLYVIRKVIEKTIRNSDIGQKSFFYIINISSRTFSYKGLLMPQQVENFFLDLKDPEMKSALCLVHSRYSTNTFPTWDLSQPFRHLAHNGEINTLRGNINWMRAREGLMKSQVFGDDIEKLKPILVPGGSDSATLDNAFELLTLAGRSLPHAMMMLIPSAWEQDASIPEDLKAFYRFHGTFMEPWDGPAAIAFTDGASIGAVLDRNGLRPARYIVTKNDFVVMASEVGVLDIEPKDIKSSGRLEPGKMFFIDTREGRIVEDDEIKKSMSARNPYKSWIEENMVHLDKLPDSGPPEPLQEDPVTLFKSFGYTREDMNHLIKPMAEDGKEPVGSMGNDTPHSILSMKPQLLYTYFKQLFAQVTNPAIDPIREEIVMSLESSIGPEKNILEETPDHCHILKVSNPIIRNNELARIKDIKINGFRTKKISILFKADDEGDFVRSIDRICQEASSAIDDGYTFILLSDRGANKEYAALPALLATGAVHHHLVRKAQRTQIGIIVESAEPREVHHFALLFGYGAGLINPYLVYEAIGNLINEGQLDISYEKAIDNYIKALNKGVLKILSKMGISTLQSYRGSQIFEALGVGSEVIDRCFAGTASRIGGVDFETIARETIMRHDNAYPAKGFERPILDTGGLYKWRKDGESHLWNPRTIPALQQATRENDYNKYKEFASLINYQSGYPTTLRSLLDIKKGDPIAIEEVESKEEIFKRFATGAMSFGSISKGTHESIAIAMNRIGGKSNTGEGGEDPARFTPLPNGDSLRSAVKQVASGRFGVTANYLVNADELQIKIAQGAKPGEGGQLPGHKVSTNIARIRYTTPGVTLISPPPHHDIYSIEDLAQLIFDLKNANPRARISVKLVSEVGVGTVAAGVAKGHADMILISGGDGGTGASPLSSIKHAGLPWELGLSETHQTLVLNDLRSRVRLQTDGQMRTGRDVVIAALLGAEEFGFSTVALIVLGCVMLRHCHLNNCALGVATQNPLLEKRFKGRPEHVVNYFHFVAQEIREIMAELGIRKIDDLVGRTDLLQVNREILPWKAKKIDFSSILYKPEMPGEVGTYCKTTQDHGIDKILDLKLIELSKDALEKESPVEINLPINNVNRTTGTMLSGEVHRRWGERGLPQDTIRCRFTGFAGQSFGAFLGKGVTFQLEGMANDYIGKGIFGGRIVVYPFKNSDYIPEENIIIGNTTFYGAISGEAYIRGMAGERFCIRNSGLFAVVEGVGDHGCEYMTGGRVVVIGKTGRNFAAGMSGGIAYVYDDGGFREKCNMSMVELEVPDDLDLETIREMLKNHKRYTGSTVAERILKDFKTESGKFIKVMPVEYKRILEAEKIEKKLDLLGVSDG